MWALEKKSVGNPFKKTEESKENPFKKWNTVKKAFNYKSSLI